MIVYFLIEKDLYKLVLFANYININNSMFFDDLTELINLVTKVHELKYLRITNIRIIDISYLNPVIQNSSYMVVINNEFQTIQFTKPGYEYNSELKIPEYMTIKMLQQLNFCANNPNEPNFVKISVSTNSANSMNSANSTNSANSMNSTNSTNSANTEESEYFNPNILYTYENLSEVNNKEEYLIDVMYDQISREDFDYGYVCMLK